MELKLTPERELAESIFSRAKDILVKCRECPPSKGIVCEACINKALVFVEKQARLSALEEAAKIVEKAHATCEEWGCEIAAQIRGEGK